MDCGDGSDWGQTPQVAAPSAAGSLEAVTLCACVMFEAHSNRGTSFEWVARLLVPPVWLCLTCPSHSQQHGTH